MTSQIPFTPLTPESMARLTLDEQMAFEAAAMTVASDQKPSLEVIATLVLTIGRLIGEPVAAEAKLAAAGTLVRQILEELCHRHGVLLDSSADPGEPARNYELADRLGIGHVFGIGGEEAGRGQ